MLVLARMTSTGEIEDAYDTASFMEASSPMIIANRLAQTLGGRTTRCSTC